MTASSISRGFIMDYGHFLGGATRGVGEARDGGHYLAGVVEIFKKVCKKSPTLKTNQVRAMWRDALLEWQPLALRLEGLFYKEIGGILDLTASNVGVRIHRAKDALKNELRGAK